MSENESSNFVKGAFILTVAGVMSKVLSAGYRIPLQNITGDIGFYIYQQVYPILGMIGMLSLYGFPSAISKLGADKQAKGEKLSWQNFYFPLFLILFCISSFLFVLWFLNAGQIASFIGDEQLYAIYQLTAVAFFMIPFISVLRGGFQANHNMLPTAVSQIGEQLIRVSIIIGGAVYVSLYGKDMYLIGYAAVYAQVIGGIIAFLILMYFSYQRGFIRSSLTTVIPWKLYIKTLLTLGFVVSLNHMILLFMQVVDVFTVVPNLMEYGYTLNQAREWKGVFDRGYPLLQFGVVLGSSFALAMIPTISKQQLKQEKQFLHQHLQSAIRISFYIASGAMIGLVIIFSDVNILLFQDNRGTFSLQILAGSILCSSLAITCITVLQSVGGMGKSAFIIAVTLFTKWYLNGMLVPRIGITGIALATVISLALLLFLVIISLKRIMKTFSFFKGINWWAFFLASVSMTFILVGMKLVLPDVVTLSRGRLFFIVCVLVSIGGGVYMYILIRLQVFTRQELAVLPFLDKYGSGRK